MARNEPTQRHAGGRSSQRRLFLARRAVGDYPRGVPLRWYVLRAHPEGYSALSGAPSTARHRAADERSSIGEQTMRRGQGECAIRCLSTWPILITKKDKFRLRCPSANHPLLPTYRTPVSAV